MMGYVYQVEIRDEDYGGTLGVYTSVDKACAAIRGHLDGIKPTLHLFDHMDVRMDVRKVLLDATDSAEVVKRIGHVSRAAKTQEECGRWQTDVWVADFHKTWVEIAIDKQWDWRKNEKDSR